MVSSQKIGPAEKTTDSRLIDLRPLPCCAADPLYLQYGTDCCCCCCCIYGDAARDLLPTPHLLTVTDFLLLFPFFSGAKGTKAERWREPVART